MLAFEWCGINQQRAELLLLQPPLHQFLQLGPARFDEVFADRALLQAVRFAELPHRLAIFPRAQTGHEFLPYRLRQRLPAMEHLVAAQPHLGTSFDSLREEMHKQTTATFLADRTLSVAEVAFLLGFSEPGAFHRAFKRWHNTTPDAFRKQRSTARQADALRNAEHSGSLPSVFRRPHDRLNGGLQLRWRIRFSQASTAVAVF